MESDYRIIREMESKGCPDDEMYELGHIEGNGIPRITVVNKTKEMKNFHGMYCCQLATGEYIVVLDNFYQDLFYEKEKIMDPLIYHELGHILNGDLGKEDADNDTQIINRVSDLEQGIIKPEEEMADRFAVKQIGKNSLLRALEYLCNQRKKDLESDDEQTKYIGELRIREFKARMLKIKRL